MKETNNHLVEKILVVDASVDYCNYIKSVLLTAGYMVHIATNFVDAIKIAHEKIPDSVLIDYMLPYGGAMAFTEEIKKDNILQNTPVLYLTANDSKSACLNALDAGADGFLLKTIDVDILLARIHAFLRHKKILEANAMYTKMLKQDIEYAARVQRSILSYGNSKIPRNDISVYHYAPNEVTGDYSGIKEAVDGWYAIMLVDVSGHGVAASMLTILIKSFFDSVVQSNFDAISPSNFLESMNKFFMDEGFENGLFASVFYAIYHNDSGRFICSSAGSPKPFLFSYNDLTTSEIDVEGGLIGISSDSTFAEYEFILKRNDLILLFTDGAYEVFDSENNMFGETRLKEIFTSLSTQNIEVIPHSIIENLKAHSVDLVDDISIIALRRTE